MSSTVTRPTRLQAILRVLIFVGLTFTLPGIGTNLAAEQVKVADRQGAIHAFLVLRDADGKDIAVGDETNEVHGNVVDARTIFRFRDGSVDDEETVYRQDSNFQLIRDHRIQKGPSFPKPTDVTIDVAKGEVSWVNASDKDQPSKSQHVDLPADLANGMIPTLVQNLPKGATDLKVSYLAVDTKPRVVTLNITPDGSNKVLVGTGDRRAERFNIHTEIGGLAGVIAPIVGQQPPDVKLWYVGGAVSTFIRMEGPFYEKGPVWSVMLASPSWPTEEAKSEADGPGEQ